MDVETGLMLYRNRYFNTLLGRFISVDPLEYDGWDVNLYRYVHNQPGIYFDPFGEKFWSLKDWWNWAWGTGQYAAPPGWSEAAGGLEAVAGVGGIATVSTGRDTLIRILYNDGISTDNDAPFDEYRRRCNLQNKRNP